MKRQKELFYLFLILVFSILLRLFQIQSLPGEWYGDISNVHEYMIEITSGKWPFYFFQSAGPFYHYLIYPIILLFKNQGYETYKYASIFVSFLGFIGTYLFVKEIRGIKLALITILIMSFSFWYLVWSRLGNSQIVIPVLISFMSYFIVRYLKRGHTRDAVYGLIVSMLGLYTYPQTYFLPVLFIFIYAVNLLVTKNFKAREVLLLLGMAAAAGLTFIFILMRQPDNFGASGYVGSKFWPFLNLGIINFISILTERYIKILGMLHIRGDEIFRSNIPMHPHLDLISGILFLIGFFYSIFRKRDKYLKYLIFMLLVLPLPSIFPAILENEIPSSARTIGIIPIIYFFIASGLWFLYKKIGWVFVSLILYFAVLINLNNYFVTYASGLPDGNLGPGKIIATQIDKLPSKYALYFGSCCFMQWGEWEPKGVVYVLRNKRPIGIFNDTIDDCSEINQLPAIVVVHPNKEEEEIKFEDCIDKNQTIPVKSRAGSIAKILFIETKDQGNQRISLF